MEQTIPTPYRVLAALILATATGCQGGGASPAPAATAMPVAIQGERVSIADSTKSYDFQGPASAGGKGDFELTTPPGSFDEFVNRYGRVDVTFKRVSEADLTIQERAALAGATPAGQRVQALLQLDIAAGTPGTRALLRVAHGVIPTVITVTNRSADRCTPGTGMALLQVAGDQAVVRAASLYSDDTQPAQKIIGTADNISYVAAHTVLAFVCMKPADAQ